jgi:preprotein translocase subunit SecG
MATALLVVHIMIALALIGVVLLQRSEGGALGIGGGGGGGFMTGRGAANFLTRVTAGLAAGFFFTSLVLSLLATQPATSILTPQPGVPGPNQQQPVKRPKNAPTTPAPSSLPPIDLSKTDPGGKGLPEDTTPKVPQSK